MSLIEPSDYLIASFAALAVSSIAAIAGYGAGLLMPFVLIPLVGAQPVVPILAVVAVLNNAGRLMAFRDAIDWKRAIRISVVAIPFCVLGSLAYTLLSGREALFLIGLVLMTVVPVRRLLKGRRIGESWMEMFAAGAVYGFLIGGTPGVGIILIPILLGMGVRGRSVIVTDSLVALLVGTVKVATFQASGFLTGEFWAFALVLGLCGIPGAYVARFVTSRMSVDFQEWIMDVGVVLGGALLVHRALFG